MVSLFLGLVMTKTGIYRLRKSFNGKCILQERHNFPYIEGGNVDASIRVFEWHDVNWDDAPLLLFADATTALKYS